jgi:hypothetical protein
MRNAFTTALTLIFFIQAAVFGQAPTTKSVVGAVATFNKDTKAIEVKPDNAAPIALKLLPNTLVQRIAPGETNLSKAVPITASDIATGDRVLVTLASNGVDALRIVIIPAGDIAKRDEADRQDWAKRGISGIVSAKNGNQILLKLKTPRGDVQQTIAVSDKTKFRRYSPDSVKFADARLSKLDEVSIGDQIRARGEKSPDGLRVDAEEVVFGTFLTRAGSVVSVDAAMKEITVKELGSGRSFSIKLTPDSSVKQMPGPTEGPGAPPAGGNIAQVIDHLPAGKFEDIKPGTSVVVSSTKGSESDKVTAILLVTNADPLIRLATTTTGRGGTLVFGSSDGGGLSVLGLQ